MSSTSSNFQFTKTILDLLVDLILQLDGFSWSLKHIEFPVLMAHFCKVSRLLVPTYFLGFMRIQPQVGTYSNVVAALQACAKPIRIKDHP
jgi:hypothetical protein